MVYLHTYTQECVGKHKAYALYAYNNICIKKMRLRKIKYYGTDLWRVHGSGMQLYIIITYIIVMS